MGGATKHNYTTQLTNPGNSRKVIRRLAMSLGFAILDTCNESKMN